MQPRKKCADATEDSTTPSKNVSPSLMTGKKSHVLWCEHLTCRSVRLPPARRWAFCVPRHSRGFSPAGRRRSGKGRRAAWGIDETDGLGVGQKNTGTEAQRHRGTEGVESVAVAVAVAAVVVDASLGSSVNSAAAAQSRDSREIAAKGPVCLPCPALPCFRHFFPLLNFSTNYSSSYTNNRQHPLILSLLVVATTDRPTVTSTLATRRLSHIRDHLSSSDTMTQAVADIGLIGLAVMGQNLILNMNGE